MKIIKEVTTTGTINHRDAYFKAALCKHDKDDSVKVILAVTLRNPIDRTPDFTKVKNILNGRIQKRVLGGQGRRLLLYTDVVFPVRKASYLFSKETLSAMLTQFKRVKERDLANELGLKWNPQEGETIKELSVEKLNGVVDKELS